MRWVECEEKNASFLSIYQPEHRIQGLTPAKPFSGRPCYPIRRRKSRKWVSPIELPQFPTNRCHPPEC